MEKTEDNVILFDDWAVRRANAFKRRKLDSVICAVPIAFLALFSVFVMVFITFSAIFILALALVVALCVWMQWLKIKNNHLIIMKDLVIITDRFGREKRYPILLGQCRLLLRHSYDRSGGIWLKFYDQEDRLICKYEDMLNHASGYGLEQTDWEKALKALNIKIDNQYWVFKN